MTARINGAWVIVLTSTNNYVMGVVALALSLRESQYPLVVLHTPSVTTSAQRLLQDAGCCLKPIDPIQPPGTIRYHFKRFAETWTKLAAWNLPDFDRVILIDADMLPIQDMDELMTIQLKDEHHIAACHACVCNPLNIESYPTDWTPLKCAYTESNRTLKKNGYFNSGLIVLTPSSAKFEEIITCLYAVEDLSIYRFPDQDFLNEIFANKWTPLPYIYNALKTLPIAHPDMWCLSDVKNIHFILSDKPWDSEANDERYRPLFERWWELYNKSAEEITITRTSANKTRSLAITADAGTKDRLIISP
ncbi:nucleotide-diphospho-sugar transferase [Dichotomocladium elegans]|nr:nucleotide-diphospho-sugar transferase [Dichotomocladium elegans]